MNHQTLHVLIKYWGKADENLIIPMNNSLSVTLERFYTETRVTLPTSFRTISI
jgi:diphosphomevalonate decarboxylase